MSLIKPLQFASVEKLHKAGILYATTYDQATGRHNTYTLKPNKRKAAKSDKGLGYCWSAILTDGDTTESIAISSISLYTLDEVERYNFFSTMEDRRAWIEEQRTILLFGYTIDAMIQIKQEDLEDTAPQDIKRDLTALIGRIYDVNPEHVLSAIRQHYAHPDMIGHFLNWYQNDLAGALDRVDYALNYLREYVYSVLMSELEHKPVWTLNPAAAGVGAKNFRIHLYRIRELIAAGGIEKYYHFMTKVTRIAELMVKFGVHSMPWAEDNDSNLFAEVLTQSEERQIYFAPTLRECLEIEEHHFKELEKQMTEQQKPGDAANVVNTNDYLTTLNQPVPEIPASTKPPAEPEADPVDEEARKDPEEVSRSPLFAKLFELMEEKSLDNSSILSGPFHLNTDRLPLVQAVLDKTDLYVEDQHYAGSVMHLLMQENARRPGRLSFVLAQSNTHYTKSGDLEADIMLASIEQHEPNHFTMTPYWLRSAESKAEPIAEESMGEVAEDIGLERARTALLAIRSAAETVRRYPGRMTPNSIMENLTAAIFTLLEASTDLEGNVSDVWKTIPFLSTDVSSMKFLGNMLTLERITAEVLNKLTIRLKQSHFVHLLNPNEAEQYFHKASDGFGSALGIDDPTPAEQADLQFSMLPFAPGSSFKLLADRLHPGNLNLVTRLERTGKLNKKTSELALALTSSYVREEEEAARPSSMDVEVILNQTVGRMRMLKGIDQGIAPPAHAVDDAEEACRRWNPETTASWSRQAPFSPDDLGTVKGLVRWFDQRGAGVMETYPCLNIVARNVLFYRFELNPQADISNEQQATSKGPTRRAV